MTQVPRKPTFPLHMIEKLLLKIQSQVNDDVIPVSTGIYSLEKLKNKLQAIPKPQIENYDDKIFFQVIEDRLSPPNKSGEKCPSCEEQYNLKKNPPVMCNFCAFYCCNNCMPGRKRPHPLSKDSNGKRYNICQRCDTRYLNLQLGHSYVQNRTLLEQAISKTTEELEQLTHKCRQYNEVKAKQKQTYQKNKFKIAQLKKEKLQLTKDIKNKMPEQIRTNQLKSQQLKQKFVQVHLKHKQWLQSNQVKKKVWQQQKEKQRILKQLRQKQQQQIQRQRLIKQKLQIEERQRIQRQTRQTQKRKEQLERQNYEAGLRKLKKTPTLSQNLILNMSLAYNQPELEKQGQEEQISNLKSIQQKEQKEPNKKEQEQEQKKNQQTNILSLKQSQAFNEYFNQQQKQDSETQQGYFNHQYQVSSKKIFESPKTQKNSQQQQQNQQYNQDQQNSQTNNFTFNERVIEQLKPQQTTWHYYEKERKKSQQIQHLSEPQFTFKEQIIQQNKQKETLDSNTLVNNPKTQSPQNISEEDNHLSLVDDWYLNKQNAKNQTQSSLSTILNNQQEEKQYFSVKKNKTAEQLEQQCTKSTSQLDESQIEVAKYSILKAARDSAVQQRQKTRIYQRSVHDMAPFDEQAQGVGQVKKCQCMIY